eukprot:CAMPEP_0171470926 /NCGR_PEP_ID=MMETSP0946-20130122/414_1 /TAXON_ID=109269 /ORGANISM="Vaucheria litorea, Strain CCMP2940" /LENGTH=1149 /DNA_ID=CAMNT_0012000347 /DNA_START=172 /DNA_END=3621 /DNA_ORIENTATION=-
MPSCMPFYEVKFEVIAELGHGEVPFVTGTCASLGNMDPNCSIKLWTTPDTYPVWQSLPLALPLHQVVLYKYGVFSGGEFKRWENIKDDRILDMVTTATTVPLATTGDVIDVEQETDLIGNFNFSIDGEEIQEDTEPLGTSENSMDKQKIEKNKSMPFRRREGSVDAIRIPPQQPGMKFATRASVTGMRSETWKTESSISSYDGVVVVSFFLPVIVNQLDNGKWVVEWDYENLLSLHSSTMPLRVTRVGTVKGMNSLSPEDEEIITKALVPFDCVPVFLSKKLEKRFYNDFCKGILWPVFHHVVDVYGNLAMKFFGQLKDLWQCYTTVNRFFRDKIVEVYNEGDIIWIHGFHLLLLPSFLTRVLRVARIGIFLHTPFPSSEIFRTLPFRDDLLRGMLNADQIGFHLFEYSRHFLTCCRRILGLNEGMEGGRTKGTQMPHTSIYYNGRTVSIESIHAGIEPKIIQCCLESGVVDEKIKRLKNKFKGRFVFVGIDKVERLKGLPLKLIAYQKMLEQYPDLVSKVCLLQIGVSVHEREEDFEKTTNELKILCDVINKKFGTKELPAVIFASKDEEAFTLQERLPYLCLADCLVNTAVRDGLNRLPLEFTIAHTTHRPKSPGVVMLSEFTSCMRVLRGAVRINPWKLDEVYIAMSKVLEMQLETRLARHAKDEDFVINHTTSFWAYQVLKDLKSIQKSADRAIMSPVGLGLNFRVIGMEVGFSSLDNSLVMRTYRPAKHRAIFLDYGGTIMPEEKQKGIMHYAMTTKQVDNPQPSKELKSLLTHLCQDPRNIVFVVSGRERDSVFSGLSDIKGLGIAAEHGLYYKWPKPDRCILPQYRKHEQVRWEWEWETLVAIHDQSWKELAKTIMDIYVKRTHGTYVEEKGSAVLWQYRDADPEFGFLQSKELEDHLVSVLNPFSLEVLRGGGGNAGGYLEVRPQGVNKGAFVDAMLERMVDIDMAPDFVLVIGDEASDEAMFTGVAQFQNQMQATMPSLHCYTCTVGKKPTEAQAYLNDIDEVHELIRGLTKVSTSVTRNYSTSALPEMREHTYITEEQLRKYAAQNEAEKDEAKTEEIVAVNETIDHSKMNNSLGRSNSIITFMPVHRQTDAPKLTLSSTNVSGLLGSQPVSPIQTALTLQDFFFRSIEEEDEDDGLFF